MQGRILIYFLFSIAITEGFLWSSSKCPIKKYKSSKYITGDQLLVHENFYDRVEPLDDLSKKCKVHLYIKGSYSQLANPSEQVLISDADLYIGHGFKFEIRDEKNAVICNKVCLAKTPGDIPEVKCFLEGAINRGFLWSKSNADVLSDGTYNANKAVYQSLKIDIQTKCQKDKFKRQLLRELRKMYEEEEEEEVK